MICTSKLIPPGYGIDADLDPPEYAGSTMEIVTRGITALLALFTLAAAMALGSGSALADPSDPYGPGPGPVIPLPGCPGFRCFGPDPHAAPHPPGVDDSGCHIDKYGAHLICPGPRTCGPFGCSDGSPSPG